MSVNIKIRNALKRYGDVVVIPNLSLDVKKGELFTLLGPSGCGKTTLLRMIAGFNTIEGGDFYFDNQKINNIDPAKRNIGMVFQNYAVFPHLTVRKNVEFGLKNRNLSKSEVDKRTNEFLKLTHIKQFAERLPERLSGGQQQRVALARALCIHPNVLLMDEPLSNLDAKLRVEMRDIIKDIQKTVGITTVYVTHDQEEAMSISDKIAVMNEGVIQHIGTPQSIYQRPANIFVATFIGRSNILDGKLVIDKKEGKSYVEINDKKFQIYNVNDKFKYDQPIKISIRPEDFIIHKDVNKGIKAMVDDSVFLGVNTHYSISLEDGLKIEITQESVLDKKIKEDTKVSLTFKEDKINIFNEEGSIALFNGVENDLVTETNSNVKDLGC
ncbi:MAG TPA: ABC transporter ATP-binding protein [Tissierellaceae bacterium]|nr:ABC transporter ATP-binding protein [Tissierellaceae bacterium]